MSDTTTNSSGAPQEAAHVFVEQKMAQLCARWSVMIASLGNTPIGNLLNSTGCCAFMSTVFSLR